MDEEGEVDRGPEQRATARLGSVLREKWRLDRLLGIGGMAAVYEASHRNGSRAAIKILHLEYSRDADAKRRFLREGYIANSVGHPGAVRIIDDDVAQDGSAFVVMELLEGQTLDARAVRLGGTIPVEEMVRFADALLDILASAHKNGVIHRDIKPDNVFVSPDGAVRLLDFGIARLNSGKPGSLATVAGSTFGTPAFMPPEQALGRNAEIDARSDLWAVGGVMFALLSGRLMHLGESLNEQLVLHASKPAPRLGTVAPSVPEPVQAVVDRALDFEKTKRWPDARAMQDALREAQRALGWVVSTSAPLPASASPAAGFSSSTSSGFNGASRAPVALAVTSGGKGEEARAVGKGRLRLALAAAGILAVGVVALGLGFGRHAHQENAPASAVDSARPLPTSPQVSASPVVAPALDPSALKPGIEASASPTVSAAPPTGHLPATPASARAAPRPAASSKPSTSAAPAVPAPPDDWLTRQH